MDEDEWEKQEEFLTQTFNVDDENKEFLAHLLSLLIYRLCNEAYDPIEVREFIYEFIMEEDLNIMNVQELALMIKEKKESKYTREH